MLISVRRQRAIVIACVLGLGALALALALGYAPWSREPERLAYQPRQPIETSGFLAAYDNLPPWRSNDELEDYAAVHRQHVPRCLAALEEMLATGSQPIEKVLMTKAVLLHSLGKPAAAYETLTELESVIKGSELEAEALYTVIYYKGLSGLRLGETDNCVLCRGESSCIFPIAPAAVHANPAGSRLAIRHFTEYLKQFPDDLEVQWLLNVAHMTLGEHPDKVDPRHRLNLDSYCKSEFDIGRFRDVGHQVGLHRLNQSGGAIMEDFDNDGLLDIAVTDWAPSEPMAFYRNQGDGTFADRTKAAGLDRQTGGLNCMQTDYNNDGHMDVFIPRGAWLRPHLAMRPSLLRNNGDGTFADVTRAAGLAIPQNANSASWADYDNDGWLDLFICDQHRPCALYRNQGDGTFANVAARAGLPADLNSCLGSAWIDLDNDGYPELFVNMGRAIGGPPTGTARLYRNNRDGTFTDVTQALGIDGPTNGFSCWAFDFDNDGWLDIFASSTSHTVEDVVKGLLGRPHDNFTAKLYRNRAGKGFQDVTRAAGLDKVYSPMGSNFGDLDNDGFLDFYLGTGDPCLGALMPNRLFQNVAGQRFAEITVSSRTGHLQKTAGKQPRTIHRHVSSGSSFGANPLEQHIGLGNADRAASLEIRWPASSRPARRRSPGPRSTSRWRRRTPTVPAR
ncbi:MAG: CRTAC1 family protein [Gemmataceae bacterium]|nr:CRTAC1 family protein [Gemmataceae bacterium]